VKRVVFCRRPQRSAQASQAGFLLIGILFVMTLMIIALAATAPNIATQIKRDREEELVRRGKQYERALQLFYRRSGRFPTSVEQLENTNNIRFLRRKYVDPITGKDEWRVIRFGQAKPKPRPPWMVGQGPVAGTGPSPTGGIAGAVSAESMSRPLSGSSTLGGGPIVGVSSTSEKEGLKEIDQKTHYNEWEFVYDPTLDQTLRGMAQQGRPPGQQGGPTPNQGPQNPTTRPIGAPPPPPSGPIR
jgi:type II secretory pathway pseudopilin PulG